MSSAIKLDPTNFFHSTYSFISELEEPPYMPNSSFRDSWLQQFYMREPHLASVVASVVSIDKNRGWTLTGSERMVRRFGKKLHNFDMGYGWRFFMSRAGQAYYTTDMGFVGSVVYEDNDPKNAIERVDNLDPARCQLLYPFTNDGYGIQYNGQWMHDVRKLRYYNPIEFIRATSMPSQMHHYNGLGYCPVSRCIELAKLMIAIYQHDQEQLLAKAPKGLLLLKGIGESQWEKAMQNRKDNLSAYERDFYGGIQVLASQTEDIEANLVALSSLPAGFDLDTFTNLLMFGYALAFGYPPEEFWPVQFGSLGRGREVEANEQRSSSKGVGNFILDLQEELQKVLPRSLQFEFKRRDTSGDMAEQELTGQRVDNVMELYNKGEGVISREEARQLLAMQGVIPQEWTEENEDTTGSDRDPEKRMLRERYADNARVIEARRLFPRSKIVHYEWPSQRVITLYDPDEKPQKYFYHVDRLQIAPDGQLTIEDDDIEQAVEGMIPAMREFLS